MLMQKVSPVILDEIMFYPIPFPQHKDNFSNLLGIKILFSFGKQKRNLLSSCMKFWPQFFINGLNWKQRKTNITSRHESFFAKFEKYSQPLFFHIYMNFSGIRFHFVFTVSDSHCLEMFPHFHAYDSSQNLFYIQLQLQQEHFIVLLEAHFVSKLQSHQPCLSVL